jgi:hypothetical protein
MSDLTAFVNARLDEDEATARYSGPALVAWLTFCDEQGQMSYTTVAAGGQGDWDSWVADGHELPEPASARVVYDPGRALREAGAKRKRLALYLDAKEALKTALKNAPMIDDPAAAHSYVRARINVNQASGRFAALEMSVRLDAMAYHDHPDYEQEWKL